MGIQNKSNFELAFSFWKVNKSNQQQQRSIRSYLHPVAGKNPVTYNLREDINKDEQKPIVEEQQPFVFKLVPKTKKSPQQSGTAKEQMDKKTNERKAELKRKLDANTAQMDNLKSLKKQFSNKKIKVIV